MRFLISLLLAFSLTGEARPMANNPEGQERCVAICMRCIDKGGEPEKCFENMFFKLCCFGNGGKANGCGCREAL